MTFSLSVTLEEKKDGNLAIKIKLRLHGECNFFFFPCLCNQCIKQLVTQKLSMQPLQLLGIHFQM